MQENNEAYYLEKWIEYVEANYRSWRHYASVQQNNSSYFTYIKQRKTKLPAWCLAQIGIELLEYFEDINTGKKKKVTPASEEYMRGRLYAHIKNNYKNSVAYAKEKKCTPVHVRNVRKKDSRIRINDNFLADLGFKRIEQYTKIKSYQH